MPRINQRLIRLWRKQPLLRRPGGRAILIGLAGAGVAPIALPAGPYALLYRDLADGKDHLLAAAELMEARGLDIEKSELDSAEASFQQAQDKLASASPA